MRSRIQVYDMMSKLPNEPYKVQEVEIRDDGVYTVEWENGRSTTTILSNPKCSLLAQMSVEAFCDGYYGEALLTCASALDAYLDFHIEVLNRASGAPTVDVEALLKFTSKQAERRLGAFLAVELSIAKKQPTYIKNSMVELRNKVVHQGYLASRDEALGYIQHVIDFIIPRYAEVHKQHQKIISELFFEKARKLSPPTTPKFSHGSLHWVMVFETLAFPQTGRVKDLNGYIEEVAKRKEQSPKHSF